MRVSRLINMIIEDFNRNLQFDEVVEVEVTGPTESTNPSTPSTIEESAFSTQWVLTRATINSNLITNRKSILTTREEEELQCVEEGEVNLVDTTTSTPHSTPASITTTLPDTTIINAQRKTADITNNTKISLHVEGMVEECAACLIINPTQICKSEGIPSTWEQRSVVSSTLTLASPLFAREKVKCELELVEVK